MNEIIITTPEQLRTLIAEAVKSSIHPLHVEWTKEPPDTITLTATLELLRENGYPTSKGKIYKLTSTNQLPHRKYGNKLVFSRRDLLAWAESQTHIKPDHSEAVLELAKSAWRKSSLAGRRHVA
jgi:hypothetical protein